MTPREANRRARRVLAIILTVVLPCLVLGYALHWLQTAGPSHLPADRIVAMSWGDGKSGSGFYGACVYLEPISDGYSVRAVVQIGRGNDHWHDCGELGRAADDAEAVAKWGKITWRPEGLYIGTGGPEHFFLPRRNLEAHR